jgi:uncharacterized protein YbaP (TraB family)
MKKLLLSLGASLLAILVLPAQEQGLLWEIESPEGKVSYLYGTYHLVGADFLKERKDVSKVFEESRMVVVETVIDSSQLMSLAPLSLMPGKSLKAMTDSLDYLLLKEKIEPVMQMDLAMLDMLKPMVLSTAYAANLAQELTPDSLRYGGLPIDMYFAKTGEEQGKEVLSLETIKEQMTILFESQTEEEQLEDLLEMLREDMGEDVTTGIIAAYHQDDLSELYEAAMLSGMEAGDMEVLLDERNQAWVPKLAPELNKGGLFIAVGALHLPGEQGLIALLQAEGYKLKPLK